MVSNTTGPDLKSLLLNLVHGIDPSFGLLPNLLNIPQPSNPNIPLQMLAGALVPGIGQIKTVGNAGRLLRTARQVADNNFLDDLAKTTDRLFRETNLERAEEFLPLGSTFRQMQNDVVHFSNTPDLALGQGTNKGVLLEFDPQGLQGQISRSKPGWDAVWEQGGGEFVGKYNSQVDYQNALRSITIRPDASGPNWVRRRWRQTFPQLEAAGWTKETLADGAIKFMRP